MYLSRRSLRAGVRLHGVLAVTALELYNVQVREVLTLRTGHRVPGPWQRVTRVHRRHLELGDGTTWPLPKAGAAGVYRHSDPLHLEISFPDTQL